VHCKISEKHAVGKPVCNGHSMSSVPKNDEMQLTLSDFDKISQAYRTFSPD